MSPGLSKRILFFWTQVRQIEHRILENGHRPSPMDVEDVWNCEFEDAYKAILPILVCISNPRLFTGVSSLAHLRGPFDADNAHQALMFQLNPEEAMYGDPSLLESEEYRDLRKQAEAEVEMLAKMDRVPIAVPILPRCGAAIWDQEYVAEWSTPKLSTTSVPSSSFVVQPTVAPDPLNYTLSESRLKLIEATDDTPRSIKELAKMAGCEYQTAKQYLLELKKMGLVQKVKQGYICAR